MREAIPLLLMLALLPPIFLSCAPAAGSPTPEPPRKETPGEAVRKPSPSPAQPSAAETETTPSPAKPSPSPTQAGPTPANVPPQAREAVGLAVEDLSRRTGVPAGEIQVQSVEEVEWRDSSLGCPEPGKMYAQVITPGYRIVLAAQGKTYDYHSDQGQRVVLCQKPG